MCLPGRLAVSLRSRRLEVVGTRENGRVRGRHACLLLARLFFLVPATQANQQWFYEKCLELLLNAVSEEDIAVPLGS